MSDRLRFTKDHKKNVLLLDTYFRVNENFDIIAREIKIGTKHAKIYFINGFVKDEMLERILEFFLKIQSSDFEKCRDARDFASRFIPNTDAAVCGSIEQFATDVYSGQFGFILEPFGEGIVLDTRSYPSRGIAEPDNDKVLRGSHEGFVETLLCNTALIRRRIRDRELIMECCKIGTKSRTDVVMCYFDSKVDKKLLARVRKKLESIDVNSVCMGQESLAECLIKKQRYNPFPKIRYTERPDSAAACIYEGNIIILTDNSPAAMIIPTSIFEFLQDTNDYYFPPVVGTYLRIIRALIFAMAMLMSPLWYLFFANPDIAPRWFAVFTVKEPYSIPVIIQILIIEVVIDALKLASLNTPNALSNSLSIIGAIVLGELAVEANLFSAEVVLFMAFVSIANFAQPSFELGYAFKLSRIFILIFTAIFGLWGFILSLVAVLLTISFTNTASGKSYLYPLIPFDFSALSSLLIRKPISKKNT
ncbi:MAG: spore germination protein [Clostridia bacterium]|nr:spore germination protein [Clostridia bacterium]